MKRILDIVVAVILFALIVASLVGVVWVAVESHNRKKPPPEKIYSTYDNSRVSLWRDPETGCEYISGGMSSALTPRLDREGMHICRDIVHGRKAGG